MHFQKIVKPASTGLNMKQRNHKDNDSRPCIGLTHRPSATAIIHNDGPQESTRRPENPSIAPTKPDRLIKTQTDHNKEQRRRQKTKKRLSTMHRADQAKAKTCCWTRAANVSLPSAASQFPSITRPARWASQVLNVNAKN